MKRLDMTRIIFQANMERRAQAPAFAPDPGAQLKNHQSAQNA
jgi:hypothetical protein